MHLEYFMYNNAQKMAKSLKLENNAKLHNFM